MTRAAELLEEAADYAESEGRTMFADECREEAEAMKGQIP